MKGFVPDWAKEVVLKKIKITLLWTCVTEAINGNFVKGFFAE